MLPTLESTSCVDQCGNFPLIEHKPNTARKVPGNHHALKYRGNALKRNKIWFQDDIEDGYWYYYYTGFQWMVASAQCDITAMPVTTQELKKKMNELGLESNHGIFTEYNDNQDNIGMHSDKEKTIAANSWIVIIKLAASRYFDISTLQDKILFHELLTAGTAIIMNSSTANVQTKHGVPPMAEPIGASGSLVLRAKKVRMSWSEVGKKAKVALKGKLERWKKKSLEAKQTSLSKAERDDEIRAGKADVNEADLVPLSDSEDEEDVPIINRPDYQKKSGESETDEQLKKKKAKKKTQKKGESKTSGTSAPAPPAAPAEAPAAEAPAEEAVSDCLALFFCCCLD